MLYNGSTSVCFCNKLKVIVDRRILQHFMMVLGSQYSCFLMLKIWNPQFCPTQCCVRTCELDTERSQTRKSTRDLLDVKQQQNPKSKLKKWSCSSVAWLALEPKRTCRQSVSLFFFSSNILSNHQAWLPLQSFDLSLASQTSHLLKNVHWGVRECLSAVQMVIDGTGWHFKTGS